jgi:anti-anti-sigma factor
MQQTLHLDSWPHENGTHVLVVSGDIDAGTAPQLSESLEALLNAGARHVVLDLAQVGFMESAGLVVLMSATNRLRRAAGDLRVASPSPPVERLFGVTRMDSVFSIFATREAALNGTPPGAAGSATA